MKKAEVEVKAEALKKVEAKVEETKNSLALVPLGEGRGEGMQEKKETASPTLR